MVLDKHTKTFCKNKTYIKLLYVSILKWWWMMAKGELKHIVTSVDRNAWLKNHMTFN